MPGCGHLVNKATKNNCQLQLRIRCLIKAAVPFRGAPARKEGVIDRSWTQTLAFGVWVEKREGYPSKHLPVGVRGRKTKTG